MNSEELLHWYSTEAEGYARIVSNREFDYKYEYTELNVYHCFEKLKAFRQFDRVLGIGSAFGDEFAPIVHKIKDLVILDPSEKFAACTSVQGIPCRYVKPNSSGMLAFESNSFDLITCFGVMHHIPNVTFVMGEIFRVLKPNGVFLIREPIVSQGDWNFPRSGVTQYERGIPIELFDQIISATGFSLSYRRFCDFQPLPAIARKLSFELYNSRFIVLIDDIISNYLPWPKIYHREASYLS